jgi:hypothetical protein
MPCHDKENAEDTFRPGIGSQKGKTNHNEAPTIQVLVFNFPYKMKERCIDLVMYRDIMFVRKSHSLLPFPDMFDLISFKILLARRLHIWREKSYSSLQSLTNNQ